MAYSKVSIPSEVYHFTQKGNLEQILSDRRIRRFGDTECWFCRSPEDMLHYMGMTVMNEGQKYIAPDRTIKRYPKFEPENYVMLRLVPAKWEDKWYQWNQELPAKASPEALQQAKEFSELMLGGKHSSNPGAGHHLSKSHNVNQPGGWQAQTCRTPGFRYL